MIYKVPILETKRLILKHGNLHDFEQVYEYDFTKLRDIAGEMEFVKYDLNKLKGIEILEENTYDWIVYLKDSMLPIGNIVADREDKSIHSTELAFNLHPLYWGCGYMMEAVIEVMNYLFHNGYENVICGYDEGNKKSKRLNEKLGFVPYKVIENAWYKNGIPITTYLNIMSKSRFKELYDGSSLEKKK